ncbi:MAG: alpha/beta fold hydrolase [Burkholderiaceae bacterium]
MEIDSRRFGAPARQVLGLLQRPMPGKPHRAAFLMCRPFGQEAVRTAPIYRAMSDRLAREGCSVLTFDTYGCGDSPGEPDAQSLAEWAGDTLAADAQLRRDAPGAPLHWFGMGLGANIAALAAQQCDTAPACLVLWEPVVDGPTYLERLLTAHRKELAREMQRSWRVLVTQGGEAEPVVPGNVLGFTVGERLHSELVELRDLPLRPIAQRGTRVVLVLQDAQRDPAADSDVAHLSVQNVETPTDWLSIEALGTAIVPQEIPRTLLATLRSDSHE